MTVNTLPRHPLTGTLALGWRKARTGEDETALHPIWPILGAAPDDEDEDEEGDDEDDEESESDDDGTTDDDGQENDEEDGKDDDAALGEKGQRALARMKDKLKTERKRRREAEGRLSAKDDGDAADKTRREAEQAATAKANSRILRSEVRAAAAGKLADPKDALRFLDLDNFEVDEDGEVDADELQDAIDDLLKNKPYLAAQGGRRFQGTGDGGAQRKAGRPKQLTEKDLDRMTPEQIVKAQDEGRLDDLLGAS